MTKYYVFLFFVMVLISSCEDADEPFNEPIIGEWYQESAVAEDADKKYRTEFVFRQDNTFESALMVVNKNTLATEGYLSLTTGNYRVDKSKLHFSQLRHYGLDGESGYQDRNRLELLYSGGEEGYEATMSFADGNSKLVLDFGSYACVALGICNSQQTYLKSM